MTPEVTVHIGLPKTGTTAAQQRVFPVLSELGLLFCRGAPVANFGRRFMVPAFAEVGQELSSFLSAARGPSLISWEGIVGGPHDWKSRADRLASLLGPKIRILISLRDPQEWLWSVYVQAIKEGFHVRYQDFALNHSRFRRGPEHLHPFSRSRAVCIDCLDFTALVRLYRSRFERVEVVTSKQLNNIENMASFFDLERGLIDFPSGASPIVNRGYSARGIERFLGLVGWLERLGLMFVPDSADDIHSMRGLNCRPYDPQDRVRKSMVYERILRLLDKGAGAQGGLQSEWTPAMQRSAEYVHQLENGIPLSD